MKRVFLLVIDGLGVGYNNDRQFIEDIGSNTLSHILQETNAYLPTLRKLGFMHLPTIDMDNGMNVAADYALISPLSVGKDSSMGHWEIAGCVTRQNYDRFTLGFPEEITDIICKAFGCDQVLLNKSYGDVRAIRDYGDRHFATGYPIVFTNTDSCLQIACHGAVYSLEELYYACNYIRENLPAKYKICRIIARPFAGIKDNYYFTKDRRDWSLDPPKNNLVNALANKNFQTISVGKVNELFAEQGFSTAYVSKTNQQCFDSLNEAVKEDWTGLCFANFGDTDILYGHRNDIDGFKECLYGIDHFLKDFMPKLSADDALIVTADHGNDPYTASTNHSREFLPFALYSPSMAGGKYLGEFEGLNNIADLVKVLLGVSKKSDIMSKIKEMHK